MRRLATCLALLLLLVSFRPACADLVSEFAYLVGNGGAPFTFDSSGSLIAGLGGTSQALAYDSNGNLYIVRSGGGLYKYDGTTESLVSNHGLFTSAVSGADLAVSSIPEPTAFLFGGLTAGLLGATVVWRRIHSHLSANTANCDQ